MNAGAAAAGVTIQYCMPYPRHALQSVELSQVTQIRVSNDHVPGVSGIDVHKQWRIGYSSMFAAALGLHPFKDGFYSSPAFQPGGTVGNGTETSPSMQNAISVLTTGPVTPEDAPGFAVLSEILRSCTVGGRLLQPSRPATAIDSQVIAAVFGRGYGPAGEVWATYSAVSGWAWGHVIAASLNGSYGFTAADLTTTIGGDILAAPFGFAPANARPRSAVDLRDAAALQTLGLAGAGGAVAYALNASSLDMSTLAVQPFDATHPITLVSCGEVDYQLWHTAPILPNGWALLGELSKYVPVSAARVASVSVFGTDLQVHVVGEAGEVVPLTFWEAASGTATTVTCTLSPAGDATAVMPYQQCS